jgi:hypothetical protein
LAKDLPYLSSYKNVGLLFDKISKAKVPEAFTVRYLSDTLGLKSTTDRQLISLLKKMGFLDSSGKPTPTFSSLKNAATAKFAIANGIRIAYAPLYESDENIHSLASDQLKGAIAQVSGAEEGLVRFITGTFNTLVKLADFSGNNLVANDDSDDDVEESVEDQELTLQRKKVAAAGFSPSFRFNIEIHLPSNGTEETYLNIFNALRKTLG